MDDLATRLFLQESFGGQAEDVVTLDECAVLVEQEAAVEVAVPRDANVGVVVLDRIGGGGVICRQDWSGGVGH
ncbi:hypothetical protein D3C78_383780 [compost metagenome]